MLEKSPQILIIPIDNRPVCYDFTVDATKIFDDLKVYIPDSSILGSLNAPADNEKLQGWTEHILNAYPVDIAIIALDTIAYGGLISSRKSEAKFEEIKNNVDNYIKILKDKNKNIKIYATSSIMRVSDSYNNEEEKSYWDKYGKDLFRFSYLSHQLLKDYDVEIEAELISLAKHIPFEVVENYLDTRKRNYEINSYYVDLVKNGVLENIFFSQDDTGKYGFNVEEKELLQRQAIKELVREKVIIKNGADEMVLSLLSRALIDFYEEKININPIFFNEEAKNIVSLYENVTIEKAVQNSIEACGANAFGTNAISLLINAPNKTQDELCLEIFADEQGNAQADAILSYIEKASSEYLIADVKKANGADNYLVEKLLNINYDDAKMFGFGAWNTTNNTLGTTIAVGIIKYLAKKYSNYNEEAFKKTQYTRLLDDWAYQANARKTIRTNPDTNLAEEMKPYQEKVSNWLGYEKETTYSLPWDRTFEVKINI